MSVEVKFTKCSPSIVGIVIKLLCERSIVCNFLFDWKKFLSISFIKLFDKSTWIKLEPKQASSDVFKKPVIAFDDRFSIAIFG